MEKECFCTENYRFGTVLFASLFQLVIADKGLCEACAVKQAHRFPCMLRVCFFVPPRNNILFGFSEILR